MRLIDADALYKRATELWDVSDSEDFEKGIFKLILNAPTIEPSEDVEFLTEDDYWEMATDEPSNQVTSKLESVEIPTVADEESTMSQPNSKLDLISRAKAIEAFNGTIKIKGKTNAEVVVETVETVINRIKELPSADRPKGFRGGNIPPKVNHVEIKVNDRPQGEWVIRENGNKECSLCGHERQDGWDYFCGYCGAYMVKENE